MNTQDKAFPNPHLTSETGMTLRDYFAAKAMEGICAGKQSNLFDDQHHLAKGAYKIADAMMEARK